MTNLKALKDLYVQAGGKLTDSYEDIFGGYPVSRYTLLADVIEAISRVVGSGGELPYVVLTAGAGSKVYLGETQLKQNDVWDIAIVGDKPVYLVEEGRKYLYPLTYFDYLSVTEFYIEFGGGGLSYLNTESGDPVIDVYRIYAKKNAAANATFTHYTRELANKTDGLPDPTGHADNSTLIIQSGEWVIQEGE